MSEAIQEAVTQKEELKDIGYPDKVICALDSETLSLKNGYIGHIRKGMTVNANFIITQRTVFQLLYDKIDNWLNPKVFDYE